MVTGIVFIVWIVALPPVIHLVRERLKYEVITNIPLLEG